MKKLYLVRNKYDNSYYVNYGTVDRDIFDNTNVDDNIKFNYAGYLWPGVDGVWYGMWSESKSISELNTYNYYLKFKKVSERLKELE